MQKSILLFTLIIMQTSLHAINLDQLQESCDNAQAAACKTLGEQYVMQGKYEEAIQAFDKASACATKEQRQTRFNSSNIPPKIWEDFYQKTCDTGHMSSCLSRAALYSYSKDKHDDKAFTLYNKVCQSNTPSKAQGCHFTGLYYYMGMKNIVQKDPKKGITLLKSSCKAGYQPSCKILGEIGH